MDRWTDWDAEWTINGCTVDSKVVYVVEPTHVSIYVMKLSVSAVWVVWVFNSATFCLHVDSCRDGSWLHVTSSRLSMSSIVEVLSQSAPTAVVQFGACWNVPVRCSSSRMQPAQPIVQDPLMPVLSRPDPATQLEEARRRLQQHTTGAAPPKSLWVWCVITSSLLMSAVA